MAGSAGPQTRLLVVMVVLVTLVFCAVEVEVRRTVTLDSLVCELDCSDPQPRAVMVQNLINETVNVRPYMITIHRCDEGSGCCPTPGQRCTLNQSEEVDIELFVYLSRTKVRNKYFTVTNHTRCSCK